MSILNNLLDEARKNLVGREHDLRLDNLIIGKTTYTIKDSETVFTDMNFCMVLLEDAYGFSYFQDEIDYSLGNFVNKNALEVVEKKIPTYLRVAIIDALFCLINKEAFKNKLIFEGNLRQKAKDRARVLLARVPDKTKVLLLGAATEIIEEVKHKNCDLKVLDLEKQKIGLRLHSTNIESGEKTDFEMEIKETDYIVATGMIFVSDTADRIFELSQKNNKCLILFMETGSNFGPQLIKHGASIVLSEFFPYYDFFGKTKYFVSQKELKSFTVENRSNVSPDMV